MAGDWLPIDSIFFGSRLVLSVLLACLLWQDRNMKNKLMPKNRHKQRYPMSKYFEREKRQEDTNPEGKVHLIATRLPEVTKILCKAGLLAYPS